MNVYTYYEPIPGFNGHDELLALWAQSWRANGWTPIILGEPQFWLHPFAKEYDEKVSKFPTINDSRYDRACFRRWLAMATTFGGVLTDYDCVNRKWNPADFLMLETNLKKLTVLCANQVPCALAGYGRDYEAVARAFAEYKPSQNDRFRNTEKLLVEDMTILQRWHICDLFDEVIVCEEYNKSGWENYPLVHCSSASLDGKRAWKMKGLMPK